MASDETWQKVRQHFRPDSDIDNWGDASAIDDELLLVLFDFRVWIGVPIYVLWGTNGKHGTDSFHYVQNGACAVDIAIPDYPKTPIDLLLDVFRFDFRGVGFYPDWKYNGKPAKGLHLDRRPLKWDPDHTKNYRENRWLGVKGTEGQVYLPFTFENINKHTRGNQWNSSQNFGLT